jgi:hypothetical protein
LEQELLKERKRLADAERTLQTKTTTAATESERIAADKAAWLAGRSASTRSTPQGSGPSRRRGKGRRAAEALAQSY